MTDGPLGKIWEIVLDLSAFLIFLYILCLFGAPFVLVLAASLFPPLIWMVSLQLSMSLSAGAGLILLVTVLIAFGPSGGRIARIREGIIRRVVSSRHRRFRAWSGYFIGVVLVSAVTYPLLLCWLAFRVLSGAAGLRWLMSDEIIELIPVLILIFWVAVILARPHRHLSRIPLLGPVIVRMQVTFIETVEGIRFPGAARLDKEKFLKAAREEPNESGKGSDG